MKKDELRSVRGVCLDIDDTLSTSGKLTAEAYASLWDLKKKGFFVVPITGRPAGWCDHIVRFWPVDAVIGENGAFSFFMQGGVRKSLTTPMGMGAAEARQRLLTLRKKILKQFPEAHFASDQSYREFDLAIDICEDVKPWQESRVKELLNFCHAEGAQAKLSSIHVNTWYGDYDKNRGFDHWIEAGCPGLSKPVQKSNWIFAGDSPNDEPLFKSFQFSVGVANIKNYLKDLQYPPRWVTSQKSGAGFVEMAKTLLKKKR